VTCHKEQCGSEYPKLVGSGVATHVCIQVRKRLVELHSPPVLRVMPDEFVVRPMCQKYSTVNFAFQIVEAHVVESLIRPVKRVDNLLTRHTTHAYLLPGHIVRQSIIASEVALGEVEKLDIGQQTKEIDEIDWTSWAKILLSDGDARHLLYANVFSFFKLMEWLAELSGGVA
jgi:hypothetical protein